jgi:hypothetical protein
VGREKSKYPKQKPIKMFGPKVLKFGPSTFILESFSSHPKKKIRKKILEIFYVLEGWKRNVEDGKRSHLHSIDMDLWSIKPKTSKAHRSLNILAAKEKTWVSQMIKRIKLEKKIVCRGRKKIPLY